jgi:hypothetical protein
MCTLYPRSLPLATGVRQAVQNVVRIAKKRGFSGGIANRREILLQTERMDGLTLCQDKEVCIGRVAPLLQSAGAGTNEE